MRRAIAGPPLAASRIGRIAPRRVGLLGGSFNPAHQGHHHVAREALRRLGLDQVWLLVSPQNPLKPARGMAPLAIRREGAQAILGRDRRLWATAIEDDLGTRTTAATLRRLVARFPRTRFVWLMGADNLIQIPRWEDWSSIFHAVAIAVFDRPSYSRFALSGKASHRFARVRVTERSARRIARALSPRWVFLHSRLDPSSASSIRAARGRAH